MKRFFGLIVLSLFIALTVATVLSIQDDFAPKETPTDFKIPPREPKFSVTIKVPEEIQHKVETWLMKKEKMERSKQLLLNTEKCKIALDLKVDKAEILRREAFRDSILATTETLKTND